MKRQRYRALQRLDFADGVSVPKGTVLTAPRIPAWARIVLARCVPLHIHGKVRIVDEDSVKEVK